MSKATHLGKPTSIYLSDTNKYVLDKLIVPERKRFNAKASRSEFINLLLEKLFIKKGILTIDGKLKR